MGLLPASLQTGGEGVQRGVGPLLTGVRQRVRTIAALPTTGRLGSDHDAVLLLGVIRLLYSQVEKNRKKDPGAQITIQKHFLSYSCMNVALSGANLAPS